MMENKRKQIVYIAGPYRAATPHGIVENIRKAESVALEYWKKGYAVICPHKNTALFDGAAPDNIWLEGDLEIMRRCDMVVVCPGWEKSRGTKTEIKVAQSLSIPVVFHEERSG